MRLKLYVFLFLGMPHRSPTLQASCFAFTKTHQMRACALPNITSPAKFIRPYIQLHHITLHNLPTIIPPFSTQNRVHADGVYIFQIVERAVK
mmetsp:Transcript_45738/g.68995  ORF Transcript_45738/g.68995 Transcript_45738/m.68995 type:complete len:92 (-) Transcript_45738:879-1154(-)